METYEEEILNTTYHYLRCTDNGAHGPSLNQCILESILFYFATLRVALCKFIILYKRVDYKCGVYATRKGHLRKTYQRTACRQRFLDLKF